MEDFVEKHRIDLFDGCRVASSGVVDDAVETPVMLVDSADGFPYAIELRHVCGNRQAARKPLRQFFQRVGAAREQGDFRATVRQSNRCRKADPRRSACHDEYAICDLHDLMLLHVEYHLYEIVIRTP